MSKSKNVNLAIIYTILARKALNGDQSKELSKKDILAIGAPHLKNEDLGVFDAIYAQYSTNYLDKSITQILDSSKVEKVAATVEAPVKKQSKKVVQQQDDLQGFF